MKRKNSVTELVFLLQAKIKKSLSVQCNLFTKRVISLYMAWLKQMIINQTCLVFIKYFENVINQQVFPHINKQSYQ